MQLPRFEHVRAPSLEEASRLLVEGGSSTRLVAGGSDLFPRMKYRLEQPARLISLRWIVPREPVLSDSGELTIDALLPLARVARSAVIRQRAPLLAEAAYCVASAQIRQVGTLGGNLCIETRCLYYNQSHTFQFVEPCLKRGGSLCYFAPKGKKCWAVFCGDTAPALIGLQARVKIVGAEGTREVPLEDLYTGDPLRPLRLADGDVLAEAVLPAAPAQQRGAFVKFSSRGGVEFAGISVAAVIDLAADGTTCTGTRIVVGAATAAPVRARRAEQALTGKELDTSLISEVALQVATEVRPLPHHGYSAGYLKQCLEVQARRALTRALEDDGPDPDVRAQGDAP